MLALWRPLLIALVLAFAACLHTSAAAQPEEQKERLLDRRPFDEITLKEGKKTIEVMPLQLPQRPLARVPGEGAVVVRLLSRPTEDYQIAWSSVARVRVFEELLLDEARRLSAAGDFDFAYDYFGRLMAEYPQWPGLNQAVSDYLRQNALALYQANQHDRALAILLTLYQRDPNYNGLSGALETVAGKIIERYLRDGDYAAARTVLELWQTQFGNLATTAAAQWQGRFETAATQRLQEATQHLRNRNYIAARTAVGKATSIWPKLPAAASVLSQIEREYPFISVGVFESAPDKPVHRIDCWPSLRAATLTQPLLSEEVGFGAEGGVYRSPLGDFQLDDSGRDLTIAINPPVVSPGATAGVSPDSLARQLLATATRENENYRADFSTLLEGVSLAPAAVRLHFKQVHVRPEALLAIPIQGIPPRLIIAQNTAEQVVFAAPENAPNVGSPINRPAVRAIVERTLPDDETAFDALSTGEIDILERVPPWQLERLRKVEGIRVESYRLPTVHVLIPNSDNRLLARREFRRALCFGIDRESIVSKVLLGGGKQSGFEVISGPFPKGASLSDPIRYAYNERIAPRPYEPRLAAILATVGWAGVNNPTGKKEDTPDDLPELPKLRLAHPNDPIARVACQSIQLQLARAGIAIELSEFAADDLIAGKVKADLRYAELAIREPLIDARTILGRGGLAGAASSPAMITSLRQLDAATNWNDVRARLSELHDIAHHELPVIPLWQTANFFAYRQPLRGIGQTPVSLYQNVEQWSTATPGNVASNQAAPQ